MEAHSPDLFLKLKQHQKSKKKKKISRAQPKTNSFCSLAWKNVTPDDSLALLAGSTEGGFMCLEEVEGDSYAQFEGDVIEMPGEGQVHKAKRSKIRKKDQHPKAAKVSEPEVLDCSEKPKGTKKKKRSSKEEEKALGNDIIEAEVYITGQTRRKKRKKNKDQNTHEAQQSQTDVTAGVSVPTNGQESGSLTNADNLQAESLMEAEEELDDLPAWVDLRLHHKIIKAIAALKFTEPTVIQRSCIPAAAHQGKDVIGAAETGSGKTLAYVVPILQRLLEEEDRCYVPVGRRTRDVNSMTNSPLRALIVTPTRELALQVCDHFRAAAKYTSIKVVPIVGGISTQKQERLLKRSPQAVVGTPGRLWELMSAGEKHLVELHSLSFFVLDEADRMVEKGHFQELQSIIGMLPAKQESEKPTSYHGTLGSDSSIPEADTKLVEGAVGGCNEPDATDTNNKLFPKRRQTFVFSATLALPSGFRKKLKKGFFQAKPLLKNEDCSVASLSERAGVRHNAAIFNLTSQKILADKVEESIIQCREEEKDAYLYYILKLHGCGRGIIFCTSIAALRRVAALLQLLQIPAWPLHAQMQQRQRLKAMDRFHSGENSVLIATDVAARGLDIPGVRTVIHYQLPHSAEVYVHRSGRTARASMDGCSILLVSPSDQIKYKSLCRALCKEESLPNFPINNAYMPAILRRTQLVQQIDKYLRKNAQTKAKTSWFKKNADALGIDMEDSGEKQKELDPTANQSGKKESIQLKRLQEELKDLLEQPLEPKSFSHRFITGAGISPLVAGQLKDFAKQKMFKKNKSSLDRSDKKVGYKNEKGWKGLVVIGQETVEPLAALRTSTFL